MNVGTESNWSIELVASISPGGPDPSSPMSNRPSGSTAHPHACSDVRGKDNLPASGLICPNPVELPLRWLVRSVGPRALTAQGGEDLKEGRIPLEWKLYNTQNESQPATQPSLNSRKIQSSAHTNYRVRQPTTRVIRSGLSSASLSSSEREAARTVTMSHDDIQFQQRLSLPTETNQQVRLVSPKAFYNSWTQGQQVTRTRTHKNPLLETPGDVDIVGVDSNKANQTNALQGSIRELSKGKQMPNTVVPVSTATHSVEESNPTTNDRNPAVSIVVHNQPVAHNATISEFVQHELDSLTPIAHDATALGFNQCELNNKPVTHGATTSEFAQHELCNLTSTPKLATQNFRDLHKRENSLRNSDAMKAEQQEESRTPNSTLQPAALSLANFAIKPVRHRSNETSSRSTVPTVISESYDEANEEITLISMDWARTVELEALETAQSRLNSNSNTEAQLSNLAESKPVQQDVQVELESSSGAEPYNDQVLCEPKPKKRHRKGKGVLRRKDQRNRESCVKGKETRNTKVNEVFEPRELSPRSNSTITHQLNTIELINNCVESQESELKLENCDENSSRRILRQNGIEMHQSACWDLDQSHHSSSGSSKQNRLKELSKPEKKRSKNEHQNNFVRIEVACKYAAIIFIIIIILQSSEFDQHELDYYRSSEFARHELTIDAQFGRGTNYATRASPYVTNIDVRQHFSNIQSRHIKFNSANATCQPSTPTTMRTTTRTN